MPKLTMSQNKNTPSIRPYRTEDMPQVEALEARIQPYRPEEEAEAEAMYLRAKQAQQSQDIRWMAIPALPPRSLMEEFDAFFVAEKENTDTINVVGIVGVQT